MVLAGGGHEIGATNRRASKPTEISEDMHECIKYYAIF